MKYVVLPSGQADNREVSFFLAMEEYLARRMADTKADDDLFFTWQVDSSVIFGRNQMVASEVNIDYCRSHGIKLFRRKSGGGCVYADRSNVMLSYITRNELTADGLRQAKSVAFTFNTFMGMLLLVLRKMGIEATGTSHNDVMIGSRKVSGTAFYHLPGSSVAHATMLYDTNMEHMLNAITPKPEKLQVKGIQSVRQRITLLKHHTSLSLNEFMQLVRDTLCDCELLLTTADVACIEQMEKSYLSEEFIGRM